MENPCYELLEEMEQGLLAIDCSDRNRLEKCAENIKLCQRLVVKLRELYLDADLHKEEAQIHFFRHIKPKVFSELIFQIEVNQFYKSKPRGSVKAKKHYIAGHSDKVSAYITKHCDFNNYIRQGLNHLDYLYFTHREYCPKAHGNLEYPVDPEFSSPADPTYSCLLAADRFIQFLRNEEYMLKNPSLDPSWEFMKSLEWQGSKTDLVELIYALHSSGSLKGDLKDIISVMERSFNVDLGYFYRLYTDIKLKKNPTSYIDSLKASLLAKIQSENR
ncbi:RteC domain-containing protein [Ekhidna sp.]|uniref:RteC domain-containing protein n=1 Tax=Ekhidna sp. TaxID=2608089 RepID=UPI00351824AD